MQVLIVFDSIFGNTEVIARALAEELEREHQVRAVTVQQAAGLDLSDYALVVVGSPTRGFAPTPGINEYVSGLDGRGGQIAAAAFDTRIDLDTIQPVPLRWVIHGGGYAGDRIAATLQKRGFQLLSPIGDFHVAGVEGPLKAGEAERAKEWASQLTRDLTAKVTRG